MLKRVKLNVSKNGFPIIMHTAHLTSKCGSLNSTITSHLDGKSSASCYDCLPFAVTKQNDFLTAKILGENLFKALRIIMKCFDSIHVKPSIINCFRPDVKVKYV